MPACRLHEAQALTLYRGLPVPNITCYLKVPASYASAVLAKRALPLDDAVTDMPGLVKQYDQQFHSMRWQVSAKRLLYLH